ncbi:MAG: tryptophan synthase beta chain [Sphaerochaeta sp.]|jgi:tryptophan synthase beta chain|uniref:Tryptophan synthase beta chain n=1 Tax=Sphaerochaeta halotolerans TaxID=2293840 RepID=A0A372MJA1_9SPIR|nr:tryptophan synthase subunit beta [Sphaerochaeta halotolerans]MDK2860319.1 tryptophan synthase beta chain [Sphaerochaeta sp.]MDN5334362.1 tryptophan synthase beta chain [Sphaerochaeta sp.]RFU95862.1 tryptophan synthase subunit beta [Sphaerochaeta halotolerans]
MQNILTKEINTTNLPDSNGRFGEFGGSYIPPQLQTVMDEVTKEYENIVQDPVFLEELSSLQRHYVGRPSPVYHAKRLSEAVGGAQIYLKREDLNHTGAHKINHCIGEVLLAKKMGKKKVIAETGAGQHGVALATAAALLGLECDIYMGEVDIKKEAPNVSRMKILGAQVIEVTRGTKTLKDAVDAAFEAYLEDPDTQIYCIGSVVGPHPFPMMVRDFQSVVGIEAKAQIQELAGRLPEAVVACVGGGSNAMGIFSAFLEDSEVTLYGVEPAGKGLDTPDHAATITKGSVGILHGFKSFLLQDESGEALPVYSIASGLDYPGVGPQHSYLKTIGRVNYDSATDHEAVEAFYGLSRMEGIIPALESSHAVAHAIKLAKTMKKDEIILVNLSGRGDKDIDYVLEHYPLVEYEPTGKGNGFEEFLSHIKKQ